jgi:hypothetical protein
VANLLNRLGYAVAVDRAAAASADCPADAISDLKRDAVGCAVASDLAFLFSPVVPRLSVFCLSL